MVVRILLNIAFTLSVLIKNMPLTSRPILPSLFPSNQLTVLTLATTNYIAQLANTHSKKPVSKVLHPRPLFQVANLFVDVRDFKDFCWPTLSELNDELNLYPWRNDNERRHFMKDDPLFNPPVMYNGPPPLPPTPTLQSSSPPTITDLEPPIITSTDKLFFIAYARGS